MIILILMLSLFIASSVWAEEKPKPPSCQEQLSDTTMQAYLLDGTRDSLERTLAHAKVELFNAQSQIAQLQKQLDDLKKAQDKPKE